MESLTSGTMAGAGSFRCRRCGYMLTLMGSDSLSDCPGCGGRDFERASLFSTAGTARRDPAGRGAVSFAAGPAGAAAGSMFDAHTTARGGLRSASQTARAGLGGARGSLRRARAGSEHDERIRFADTLPGGGRGALSRPEPIDTDAWLADARAQLPEPGEYLAYEDDEELKIVPLTREWIRIGRSLAADVRFDDPTVSRRHALVVRQTDGVRLLDDRSLNGVFVNGSRVEWKTLRDGDEIVVGRYRLRFLSAPAQLGRASAAAGTLQSVD